MYFYKMNLMPSCFWITKESYWDQKRCDKERIYSYIYSYIPLDSIQYNALCIISSIHVKSIQNLLVSSSEIWYIQLSFKIISFCTILLQLFFYNIHIEILSVLLGSYSYMIVPRKKEIRTGKRSLLVPHMFPPSSLQQVWYLTLWPGLLIQIDKQCRSWAL